MRTIKYVGSKARIAKDIVPIIQKCIDDNGINVYVEPFVGGGNTLTEIKCKHRFAYDKNYYLIDFWKALQSGWQIQNESMSKELYDDIRQNKDKYPTHIVALAGFCATYNAKWFGGYAGIVHTKAGTIRNYYDEAVRNVIKQVSAIQGVNFICSDYRDIKVPQGAVIYCDPPYKETTGYQDSIDYDHYWQWIRDVSKNNYVLCSEYEAPDDFECIWYKDLTTTLDNASRSKATERLFTYKNGLYNNN